ncbi:unnamed protein product, partial [Rotaria sp. Silwood1]
VYEYRLQFLGSLYEYRLQFLVCNEIALIFMRGLRVSEAICESAASILKGHIHKNRSLQHKSLDDEIFLHWNAPPLHLADKFIEQSIDDYFINKKDKTWLFYMKNEQYQPWRLLSPGSLVLNRFQSEQVPKLPELIDD